MIYRINSASACRRRMKGTTPLAERGAKAPSPPASRCVLLHCPFSAVSAGAKRHKECFSSQRPRTHALTECSDPVLPCQFCPALLDLEKKNLKTLGKARGWVCTLKNRSQICVRTLKVRTFIGVVAFSVDFPSWRVPRSCSHPHEQFYSLFGRFALVYGSRRNPILIAYPCSDLFLFWI